MSGRASFRRLDYRLRINKHIERRLVFDVLQSAAARIGLRGHRYLGLGSLWFVDFRLAHRKLRIDEMVSFEEQAHAGRAKFNKPYGCIEIVSGRTHEALPALPQEWWGKPGIWWLDYDGSLTDEVVGDIDLVIQRGQPDTVLIISINAERAAYRGRNGDLLTREDTAVGEVERLLGSGCLAPEYDVQPNERGLFVDIDRSRFPTMLADATMTYMSHAVVQAARRVGAEDVEFVPLFQLHHADDADMVTVGGALTVRSKAERWRQCVNEHALLSEGNGPVYRKLDLVPITLKEVIELDSCLPLADPNAFFKQARKRGLDIGNDDLRKYHQYYRHFPVFAEAAF